MAPENGAVATPSCIRCLQIRGTCLGVAVILLLAVASAWAQNPATSQPTPQGNSVAQNSPEAQAYQEAVSAIQNGSVAKMEQFATTPQYTNRHVDSMEWLVWTYKRTADAGRAQRWASDLLEAQPGNALALATLANADQQLTQTSPAEPGAERPLSMAKQALREIRHLQPPEGMTNGTFAEMREELERTLNGAIGYAYFQRNDYVTARTFLRKAAALAPANAQYAYALAIADLEGRDPDKAEGYVQLARAVNLTQGTAPGQELARYARDSYKRDGGTDKDWDTYIANTRPPTIVPKPSTQTQEAAAQPPPASSAAPPQPPSAPAQQTTASGTGVPAQGGTAGSVTASTTTNASGNLGLGSTTQGTGSTTQGTQPASAATSSAASTAAGRVAATAVPPASTAPTASTATTGTTAPSATTASAAAPAKPAPPPSPGTDVPPMPPTTTTASLEPPPVLPPRPPRAPRGSPLSLGILIETSATSKESRDSVINTLSDLVRHMREHDEAFLVSFSKDVVFEQDLTSNPNTIEEAMDKIKPNSGTALYDAVAFAAGHLKRISSNANRVLLVVSDGTNTTTRISPLELSGDLRVSGVQIYCIGLQTAGSDDQKRLTALADATGGSAVFLAGPDQFRLATRQIAEGLGIPFE